MTPGTTGSPRDDSRSGDKTARPDATTAGAPRGDAAGEGLLEPERRCRVCGAKLTVQILPDGLESHCTPCERRARACDNC